MSDDKEKKDKEEKSEYHIISRINAEDINPSTPANIIDIAKKLSESDAAMKAYLADTAAIGNIVEEARKISMKTETLASTLFPLISANGMSEAIAAALAKSFDPFLNPLSGSLVDASQKLVDATLPTRIDRLSHGLGLVEDRIDEIIPQVRIPGPTPENQIILEEFQELKTELNTLRIRVEELIGSSRQTNSRMPRSKRGPNPGTTGKIKKLAEYRASNIRERGVIPSWLKACKITKIDPRLVSRYALELRENWDIKDFIWQGLKDIEED